MRPLHTLSVATAFLLAAPVAGLGQTTARPAGAVPAAWPAGTVPTVAGLSAFSAAVVVQDGRIFVGRPGGIALFPMPSGRQGGVHVFGRTGGEWAQTATLSPTESGSATGFGGGLDAAGDLLVVGAPTDGAGAVYVFRWSGSEWAQDGRLTWDDGGADTGFGQVVATNGDAVLVGAPGSGAGSGAVVAFASGDDGWALSAVLEAAVEPERAGFGTSLDMEGDLAAVGAPGEMIGLIPGTGQPVLLPGAVHIFRRGAEGWTREGRLTPPGSAPGAMGWGVAVSGGQVFAGAPLDAGTGTVQHFTSDGGDWSHAGTITADDAPIPAGFGMAVAASGDDLVVGMPLVGGGIGGGAAFRRDASGDWSAVASFGPGAPFNFYGLAVAVDGDMAVVGAPGADFFEGTGFLFRRTESGWEPEGTLIDDNAGLDPLLGEERECEAGAAGGFSCSEVDLVAFLPTHAAGGGRGVIANDLWGWTDPETGREYAIMGRADATTFIDLGDPSNPAYLGELPLTEGAIVNMWRDIKVYENHAFIVADNAGPHGVQIFDLTQLRDLSGPPVTFEATAHYDGINSAHNIVINEETGFAYVVGASGGGETCGGGLHMIDVRDPAAPVFAGCFADPNTGNAGTGYSHDAQCVRYDGPDEAYAGREICFGANETALSIADVTDKEAPVTLSAASYPNTGYLHQGWISDDHRYFYMNDETDEVGGNVSRTRTLVWDVQELDDPVLVKEHFGTTGSSDHNLYVVGDLMYQANYLSGLRILDISDPEEPVEVGYFDTVPFGDNGPGFAGAWSVYPYFESGVLIVSSIKEGLFVLKKRPPRVS